jgi:hypothetical protein
MLIRKRWFLLAAATALLTSCGTVQQTERIGPSDPSALAAIRAAYLKASDQKSYRAQMTMTGSDGKVTHGTIEFAAPSNAHVVMQMDGRPDPVEHILYNGTLYIKGGQQWVRSPVSSDTILEQIRKDPRTIEDFMKTLSGAQTVGPDPVNGKPAIEYRFYQAGSIAGGMGSTKGWVTLWVGGNGLPVKAESDSETKVLFVGGHGKSTIYYSDYNAPIRISAPPV